MRWTRFVLFAAGAAAFLPAAPAADDKPAGEKAPRAVVEEAVAAAGGKEKLAALAKCTFKSKGTLVGGDVDATFESETRRQGLDKAVSDINVRVMGLEVRQKIGVDGETAWVADGRAPRNLRGAELSAAREEVTAAYLALIYPLLEGDKYKLEALPEAKIDGKDAVGVRAVAEGQKPIEFYFDYTGKKVGALVKIIRKATIPAAGKEVTRETFYTDPKEVGGGRYAAKMVVKDDGKKTAEVEVTELKVVQTFDDKAFAKP